LEEVERAEHGGGFVTVPADQVENGEAPLVGIRQPRRRSGMSAPAALSGRRRSAGSGSRSYCHWSFVASAAHHFW
jgi:hypothetical protein